MINKTPTSPVSLLVALISIATVVASGCSQTSHSQRNALAGGALGTAAGAVIGHQSDNTGTGALIGGAVGSLGGALVGDAQDARDERDSAIARAEYAESQLAVHNEPPITNDDLIMMTRSGVSADVIITAVQTRGGRFDLSTNGLIQLSQNGVSDEVIRAIQSVGQVSTTTVPANSGGSTSVGLVIVPRPIVWPAPRRIVVSPPRRVGVSRARRRW